MNEAELLGKKIDVLWKRLNVLIESGNRFYGNEGNIYLQQRTVDKQDGYAWSGTHTSNMVFLNFRPAKRTGGKYGESRYYIDTTYFYYHHELQQLLLIPKDISDSDYITMDLIDYNELTPELLFQYSTLLDEKQLEIFACTCYLKSTDISSIALNLDSIDEIMMQSYYEPYTETKYNETK